MNALFAEFPGPRSYGHGPSTSLCVTVTSGTLERRQTGPHRTKPLVPSQRRRPGGGRGGKVDPARSPLPGALAPDGDVVLGEPPHLLVGGGVGADGRERVAAARHPTEDLVVNNTNIMNTDSVITTCKPIIIRF